MDIKTLTRDEAQVFLEFLRLERKRHMDTVKKCDTWMLLWLSEQKRQWEEVEHIDGGIAEVNKKFGLEEK